VSRFDFTKETFPVWLDDEVLHTPGFDELVDRLMNMEGWDREDAEARAEEILRDDAA